MSTLISSDNIQADTLASFTGGPTITNVQVTDSSYNVIDDTAVPLTGGYIKITGSKFLTGAEVLFNNTYATSVTVVSNTVIHAQVGAQSAGTYILYVSNTDGGTAIRVNGITFSGYPTWVTNSTLPLTGVGEQINIQLSATGDAPITYQVQSGSTLPPGVTLSSGGLLTGSVTGINAETTYNFTIEALDNELQESPRTFSITISTGDLYWDNVTTLLSSTATPFTSMLSSGTVFELIPQGDTKPNNFNPYSNNYYSAYFDGTGDYLTSPSNSWTSLAGQFTVEFWVNFNAIPTANPFIGAMTAGGFNIYNDGTRLSPNVFGTGNIFNSSVLLSSLAVGTWYHIAVTRNSSNLMTMWLNGISQGTATTTSTYTANAWQIGNNNFNCYISNFRATNTCQYTTTFTPPTSPLTAISGTNLLTCQSNRFIDNSTNNFAITKNGDTKITSYIPFAQNSSYSTYGSTYFDGTGDYINTSSSNQVAITTGEFTIEAWIYPTTAKLQAITNYSYWNIGQNGGWRVAVNASNFLTLQASSGTYNVYPTVITATTPVVLNAWNHIAVVRNSSNQINLYVNGAVAATPVTYSTSLDLASAGRQQTFNISGVIADGGLYDTFVGYLTDLRIVQGTAVYTSAFTPPTQPLSLVSNTIMLTCQGNQPSNSSMLIDDSTNNLPMTRFGNITQGSFSPYGESWSVYFDGTGDYINMASNSNYALGTENFTVEFWIYNTVALDSNNRCVLNTNNGGFFVQIRNNAIGIGVVNTAENNAFTYSMQVNTWYHIAISRTGSTVYAFANGTLISSASNSVNYAQNGLWIGALYNGAQLVSGYISNIRIVKGTGLYTSSFNPSSTPLQAISGTVLLTCEANNFIDISPIAASITVNGDPRIQRFSPFSGTLLPTPYYSAYFDGSGDYLTVASSSSFAMADDFTMEGWVFPQTQVKSFPVVVALQTVPISVQYNHIDAPGKFSLIVGATRISGSETQAVNTWYHVAVVRSGSTITLYINGIAVASTTNATAFGTSVVAIGGYDPTSTDLAYTGYVSNVRIVNGTAVYTANFTPPTNPLTAISGTSLLTCQSNTFIDNSTNNFTITANGDSKPTTFSPFTVEYSTYNAYTPSTIGGSIYGDNDGDYVIIPGQGSSFLSPALGLGTGDFTVECWVYPMNDNSLWLWDFRYSGGGSGQNRPMLGITLTQAVFYTGATARITNTYSTKQYAWTHFAIVRKSGVTTMYINGIATGATYSASDDFGTSNTLTIGTVGDSPGYSTTELSGYVSDLRVVRSSVYSSNFVVPNAPLTNTTNTTFLGNMSNFGIYDSSMDGNFETLGNTKLSTAVKKYNSSSMYFDGTGDYLRAYGPTTDIYAFGTGDFTIECWIYLSSFGASYVPIFNNAYLFYVGASGQMLLYNGSTDVATGTNGSVTVGSWIYLAWTRASGAVRMFVNGTQTGTTATVTASIGSGTTTNIGTHSTANLNGYIDDLRITKGVARYTSNFSAPTAALTRK